MYLVANRRLERPQRKEIVEELSNSSSSEEMTVQDIIKERPSTKVVREFMKDYADNIKTEEDEIFG